MSDQTMRAAIAARLNALGPVIGRVHDYERWTNNTKQFLELFQNPATKKIFGWEITRTGFKVSKITMVKWKLSHQYIIRGYYALEDAEGTDKAVNGLADLIALDFTRTPLPGTQGEQLPEGAVETRMFGQYLCHVVEIQLPRVDEIIKPDELEEADLLAIGLNYYLTPGDDIADAVDTLTLNEQ